MLENCRPSVLVPVFLKVSSQARKFELNVFIIIHLNFFSITDKRIHLFYAMCQEEQRNDLP